MTLNELRLTKNRVLVLLPPAPEVDEVSGLLLVNHFEKPISYGRVLLTGPMCRDVHEGDMVAWDPKFGEPMPLTDSHATVFLRESEVEAIIPRKGQA